MNEVHQAQQEDEKSKEVPDSVDNASKESDIKDNDVTGSSPKDNDYEKASPLDNYPTEPTEAKLEPESEMFIFLKSLRLDSYYPMFVENGASHLDQLIYVEDWAIQQLCDLIGMKMIHAAVFTKAMRECRYNTKMATEAAAHPHDEYTRNPYIRPVQPALEPRPYLNDIRRPVYNLESFFGYPSFPTPIPRTHAPPQPPQQSLFQLYAATQIANDIPSNQYSDHSANFRPPKRSPSALSEDRTEINPDTSPADASKSQDYQKPQLDDDGSYYVKICDQNIRFPAIVKNLTHFNELDASRREFIRKGSQIYGRDDTKRKHNTLTPLEMFMNEVAYEICTRDFTYMLSRQRLLTLVREIIKDNNVQLSGFHSALSGHTFKTYITNGKSKSKLFSVVEEGPQPSSTRGNLESEAHDYQMIYHHKMYKEWPPELTRERRKYLSRRSSNFELIDDKLFYAKDNKRKRWISDMDELQAIFDKHHVDSDSGCHYSREATIDAVSRNYYCKNIHEKLTKFYIACDSCRVKYISNPVKIQQRKSTPAVEADSNVPVVKADNDPSYLPYTSNRGKKKWVFYDVFEVNNIPPGKKSRKSMPQKLVIGEDVATAVAFDDKVEETQPKEENSLEKAEEMKTEEDLQQEDVKGSPVKEERQNEEYKMEEETGNEEEKETKQNIIAESVVEEAMVESQLEPDNA